MCTRMSSETVRKVAMDSIYAFTHIYNYTCAHEDKHMTMYAHTHAARHIHMHLHSAVHTHTQLHTYCSLYADVHTSAGQQL